METIIKTVDSKLIALTKGVVFVNKLIGGELRYCGACMEDPCMCSDPW